MSRHISRKALLLFCYLLLIGSFSANALVTPSVPSASSNGNYTVTWPTTPPAWLEERFNGGVWNYVVPPWAMYWGQSNYVVTNQPDGVYEYRFVSSPSNSVGFDGNSSEIAKIIVGQQSSVIVNYTYDALGRLTFVEDSINDNQDYDYDAAGNRLNVAKGTDDDSQSEPVIPIITPEPPTGLSCSLYYYNSYEASWMSMEHAAYYIVYHNFTTTTVSSTSYQLPSNNGTTSCTFSVKACASNDECSAYTQHN